MKENEQNEMVVCVKAISHSLVCLFVHLSVRSFKLQSTRQFTVQQRAEKSLGVAGKQLFCTCWSHSRQ